MEVMHVGSSVRPSGLPSGRSCTSICDRCSSVWSISIVTITAAPDDDEDDDEDDDTDDDDDDDDDGIAEITPVAIILPSPVVLASLPMASSPVALLSLETSELRGVCLEENAYVMVARPVIIRTLRPIWSYRDKPGWYRG